MILWLYRVKLITCLFNLSSSYIFVSWVCCDVSFSHCLAGRTLRSATRCFVRNYVKFVRFGMFRRKGQCYPTVVFSCRLPFDLLSVNTPLSRVGLEFVDFSVSSSVLLLIFYGTLFTFVFVLEGFEYPTSFLSRLSLYMSTFVNEIFSSFPSLLDWHVEFIDHFLVWFVFRSFSSSFFPPPFFIFSSSFYYF